MRKSRDEIDRTDERFRQLSDKVDKNKMDDAEMAAELQGGERRVRWVTAAWRSCCNCLSLWERIAWRPCGKGYKESEEKW